MEQLTGPDKPRDQQPQYDHLIRLDLNIPVLQHDIPDIYFDDWTTEKEDHSNHRLDQQVIAFDTFYADVTDI